MGGRTPRRDYSYPLSRQSNRIIGNLQAKSSKERHNEWQKLCDKQIAIKPQADWQKDLVLEDIVKKGLDLAVAQQLKEQIVECTHYFDHSHEKKAWSPREEVANKQMLADVREAKDDMQHSPSKSAAMATMLHVEYQHEMEAKPLQVYDALEVLQHFKIESMLTHKCLVFRSNKLRGRRFVLKQLTEKQLELFDYRKEKVEHDKIGPKERLLNSERNSIRYWPMIEKWAYLPAQLPVQNFNTCYGITQIRNSFYVVSDFVQDWTPLPSQISESDNEDWLPNLDLQER